MLGVALIYCMVHFMAIQTLFALTMKPSSASPLILSMLVVYFSNLLPSKVVKIEILLKIGKKHVDHKSEDRNTDRKILQML